MNQDPEHREICVSVFVEHLEKVNRDDFDSDHAFVDKIINLAVFCLGSVTEEQLRIILSHRGIDIGEYRWLDVATDVVSAWVAAGGLKVTDLLPDSLVRTDTPLCTRVSYDEEFSNYISTIRTEGIFFRDFVVTNSMG